MHATTSQWSCTAAAFAAMLQLVPAQAAPAPAQPVRLQAATNRVGLYEKIEFPLEVLGSWTNPFDPDEVEVSLQLTAPGGQSLTVPAFYCQDYERRRLKSADQVRDWLYPRGNPGWKARFAPMQTGDYSAVGTVKEGAGTRSSGAVRFTCEPSANRGFVRVSAKDPRFLEFSQGQPYFPIGQNLAFIGSQQYVTLSKAEEIFGKLAENGADYLRIWTCCDDWATAIEARKSAWGRSWDWHPPIVPMPGEQSGRKCLKLPGNGSALRIDPSHPVAVRPGTSYMFSGKVRVEGDTTIKLEGNQFKPPQSIGAGPAGSICAAKISAGVSPGKGFRFVSNSYAETP